MRGWACVFAIVVALLACGTVPHEPTTLPEPERKLLLEVIQDTSSITGSVRLVYLRAFSDGTAECHPSRNVDYSNLALTRQRVPPREFERLEKLLTTTEVRQLDSEYPGIGRAIDYFVVWTITIPRQKETQRIVVVNFQPEYAERMKKPYPRALVKLECLIRGLRPVVSGETPLFEDAYCRRALEAEQK
jgi:hypothetical protein